MNLSNEDREWINSVLDAKLEKVATRFELESLEARFGSKLESLETRFGSKLESLETRFDANLESLEARFGAKLERVETTLLTEFHKWASPTELRMKSHSAVLRVLDADMESLAERVRKLEPPH